MGEQIIISEGESIKESLISYDLLVILKDMPNLYPKFFFPSPSDGGLDFEFSSQFKDNFRVITEQLENKGTLEKEHYQYLKTMLEEIKNLSENNENFKKQIPDCADWVNKALKLIEKELK